MRVLFPSFWSTNFLFFPILLIFTVRKMDFVRVKIENLLHESECLVQQLVFCLPEFNCGGSVDGEHYSLLKVCSACEFREICSAVTGWVRTEAEMVPNLPARLCVEENTAAENWERFKLVMHVQADCSPLHHSGFTVGNFRLPEYK